MVNIKDLKLSKHLPPKWLNTLYEHFKGKYSIYTVRNVVYGERYNLEIYEKAIELAEEYKAEQRKLIKKVNNLKKNN